MRRSQPEINMQQMTSCLWMPLISDVLNADSGRYDDALLSQAACDGCSLLSPSSAIHPLRKTWITKQYTSVKLSSHAQ